MSAAGLVMVTEIIDPETGETIHTYRTQDHGWESAEQAVSYWTERGHFRRYTVEHYRNGKSEELPHVDVIQRTYFEESSA